MGAQDLDTAVQARERRGERAGQALLRRLAGRVLTAKGLDTVGVLRLGAVSLQGYTVRNVDVFVLNNALGTGLLGLNFLRQFKVTMDSSRGEFRLESP